MLSFIWLKGEETGDVYCIKISVLCVAKKIKNLSDVSLSAEVKFGV